MLNKLQKYSRSGCLVLGAISVCALPPYNLFPVLFFTFSTFLLLLNSAANPRAAFRYGYWFGFGYFAVGLSWIGNALLIDAASFGWLYPLSLLASGAFFGLFFAVPAWLTFYFRNLYSRLFAFAAFMVLSEWIRSFILTGFPWNLLGTSLSFSIKAIQTASIFGTFGLSLLVILLCSAPALFIRYKNKTSLALSISICTAILAWLCVYGNWHIQKYSSNKDSDVTLRLVQPAIPQAMKWNLPRLEENLQQYINLSRAPGLDKVDFVIWGETATPFPLDVDTYHMNLIKDAVPPHGFLITGLVRYDFNPYQDYQPVNSMFVINPQGVVEDYYDKAHLVPFGEYIPLRRFLPDWVRPVTNTIANFKAGPGLKSLKIADYPAFGGLICYEIIFPAAVAGKTERPQWLLNLTNDGWYGDSAGPYQHLTAAVFRAVEEGILVVRVANTGISAVISPLGKVIASLPLNQSGILDVRLPQNLSISTFYGKYGNLTPLILCFLNIMLAFYLSLHKL